MYVCMYIYIYDRAYASSSSCDGKRACACAPKASAADARVQKIARPRAGPEAVCLLPAAAATSALCMCPERRPWQSQRVQGWARMQPTDLWATSECRRLAAPTERLPGGRQRHPTTSLRGPRPSTDASAAPLPAALPAIRPGSSVGALCECAPLVRRRLRCRGRCRVAHGARCSPPRPRARSWSLAPRSAAAFAVTESVTTTSISENLRIPFVADFKDCFRTEQGNLLTYSGVQIG